MLENVQSELIRVNKRGIDQFWWIRSRVVAMGKHGKEKEVDVECKIEVSHQAH